MKKKDLILIAVVLLAALAVWAGMRINGKRRLAGLKDRQISTESDEKSLSPTATAAPDHDEEPSGETDKLDTVADLPAQSEEKAATDSSTQGESDTGSNSSTQGESDTESNSSTQGESDTGVGSSAQADQGDGNASQTETKTTDSDPRGYILITIGGEMYGEYGLSEDQDIWINDTNLCRIENGEAVMIKAECPDQLCTKMGPVSGPYDLIVCLPNLVVIEWEENLYPGTTAGTTDGKIDAVS